MLKAVKFISLLIYLIFSFMLEVSAKDFRTEQMKNIRVKNAYLEKEMSIKQSFIEKNLSYPPNEIYLRVLKSEKILELWIRSFSTDTFQLYKEYKICAISGVIGPKRKQGDGQIPEGFYFIDGFNPNSNFYLSLKINYPNESDKILGTKGYLGGNICIHGNCVTIGCIPITDDCIKEVYLLAIEAYKSGQRKIPVHIFPFNLSDGNQALPHFSGNNKLNEFWNNLKVGCDYFQNNKKLPRISVRRNGTYQFE